MSKYKDWSIEFPKQRFKGRAYGLYSAISKRRDVTIDSAIKDIAKIEFEFGIGYEMLLFAKPDTVENIIIRKLYDYNAKYTKNCDLFVTGFKEGYTAYNKALNLNMLLKEIDLPCKINLSNQSKLYFAEGNVFGVEGFGFDGIACFLPNGMFMINGDYYRFKENNPDNVVAAIYDFHNQQRLSLSQIPVAVNGILDMLYTHKCRKIGFHGIKIYGINDYTAEHYTIDAVSNWLKKHFDEIDSITMVDRFDSYSKHL